MATKAKKKQNIFAAYFTPFGLRQVCDLTMLAGVIVLIVGLCTTQIVTAVGIGLYIVASCIAVYRAVRVLLAKSANKRSPEYKNARINVIIMSVVLALAILAILAISFGW